MEGGGRQQVSSTLWRTLLFKGAKKVGESWGKIWGPERPNKNLKK